MTVIVAVRVLFVDPGSAQSAYALWDGQRVIQSGKFPNGAMRSFLELQAEGPFPADVFGIEAIASYGMAVGAEVFTTCIWVGRYFETILRVSGTEPKLVFRQPIKMHLCKSPKAKDGNVRQALIDRIGPPGKKKAPGPTYGLSSDVWAALAGAVYLRDTL